MDNRKQRFKPTLKFLHYFEFYEATNLRIYVIKIAQKDKHLSYTHRRFVYGMHQYDIMDNHHP